MSASEIDPTPSGLVDPPHTSVLLRAVIDDAAKDYFTLDWLVGHLPKNSFGVILLFLGLFSILPVVSILARLLIVVLLLQIILGYHSPALPKRWMTRRLPSHYLARLDRHTIPALRGLEKLIRPRGAWLLNATRRLNAFIFLLLTILSLVLPIPLFNIPVAVASVMVALAYIEHDGLLLVAAMLAALGILMIVAAGIDQSFGLSLI